MKRSLTLLVGVAAASASFFVARHLSKSSSPDQEQGVRSAPVSSTINNQPTTQTTDPLQATDPLERLEELIGRIKNAPVGEVGKLWDVCENDSALRPVLAARWAELDPQNFLTHLVGEDADEVRRDALVIQMLFQKWAVRQPEQALAAAIEHSSKPRFSGSARDIIQTVAGQDLFRAVQLAKGKPVKGTMLVSESSFGRNVAAFLEAVLPESLPNIWDRSIRDAVAWWTKSDPTACYAWVAAHPQHRERLLPIVMQSAAAEAPDQMVEVVMTMPRGQEREKALRKVLIVWFAKDPSSTVRWLAAAKLQNKESTLSYLIETSKVADPATLATAIDALNLGPLHDAAVRAHAAKWAASDPLAASAWLGRMPDDPSRWNASQGVLIHLAKVNLQEAQAMASMGPSDYQRRAQGTLAVVLALEKSKDFIPWALKLPEAQRQEAITVFFREIGFKHSLEDADPLLASVPDPKLRAAVIPQFLSRYTLSNGDISEAIAWAKQQKDPVLKDAAKKALLDESRVREDKLEAVREAFK